MDAALSEGRRLFLHLVIILGGTLIVRTADVLSFVRNRTGDQIAIKSSVGISH